MRLPHLIALAAGIVLSGCASAAAAAAPARLQVLVEDAASPWSNRAGQGVANDMVRAAFSAAGVDVELVVVPYARCKTLVMQGGAAACFSMSDAPELRNLVRFADKPLFSVTPRFYYNIDHKVTAKSVADLARGMRVGIVHGYEYPPFVAQLPARGILVESARSDVANLRKLAAGRIDVALVMTDDLRGADLVQQQAGVKNIALAFVSTPQDSFIGFSTSHPNGELLRRSFNTGYQAIIDNGTRATVQSSWKLRCAKFCPE
jgi:ABC-type amino acid transport substrate-binding protein